MEEISISELFKYYFGKVYIVLVFILIGILGAWYYTAKLQVPMYKSQTSLVLTRSSDSTTITQTDITLNKNLVSTYREIIKSRRILSAVIKNLKLDLTVSELSSKVGVKSANDTELIVISVVDEDSNVAKVIANEIASVFKDEIIEIYNIENISIVDKAVKAQTPYNINILKQYLLGFGAGFLLGSSIVIMMFYFDDSIKTTEDIENKIGLNVLSSVPKYKPKKKKKNAEEGDE